MHPDETQDEYQRFCRVCRIYDDGFRELSSLAIARNTTDSATSGQLSAMARERYRVEKATHVNRGLDEFTQQILLGKDSAYVARR